MKDEQCQIYFKKLSVDPSHRDFNFLLANNLALDTMVGCNRYFSFKKIRHVELLKYSKPGYSLSNDLGSMDVQILSRFLEVKLTICQCLYRENTNVGIII